MRFHSMPPGIKRFSDVVPVPPMKMFRDELYYNHKTNEPFENVLKEIRNNPSREMSSRSVGFTLFHMGIVEKTDPVVIDLFERYVEKYRGEYCPRLAFGALSGGLRCNLRPFCLRVFLEDVVEHQKEYSKQT